MHKYEYDGNISQAETYHPLYGKLIEALTPAVYYNTYYLGFAKTPYGLKLSIPSPGESFGSDFVSEEIDDLASRWRAFGNRMCFYETHGVDKETAKGLTDHMRPDAETLAAIEDKVKQADKGESIGEGLKAPADAALTVGSTAIDVFATLAPMLKYVILGVAGYFIYRMVK